MRHSASISSQQHNANQTHLYFFVMDCIHGIGMLGNMRPAKHSHIETGTKWRKVCRRYFYMHCLESYFNLAFVFPCLIHLAIKYELTHEDRFEYFVLIWPVKILCLYDDVIKWKHFPHNWPFVGGIHRSRWIPHTKTSDAELWCFRWSASE